MMLDSWVYDTSGRFTPEQYKKLAEIAAEVAKNPPPRFAVYIAKMRRGKMELHRQPDTRSSSS